MSDSFDIVIVGGGFSGLGMAIQLKRTGHGDFVILEKADDLGGTWRDNTYPGCACDVPSCLYSFSFAQNPRWSRMFSPQQEIYDYLKDCATRFDLEPHLRYGSAVTGAVFDESTKRWTVEVGGSRTMSCRVIAKKAAHVDLYQRTPAWVVPRPDAAISDDKKLLYARRPITQRVLRDFLYWVLEVRGAGFTVSPRLTGVLETTARRHLQKQVPDSVLRARLKPSYQIGCKRVLLSSTFYPALQRPNVDLVTTGIDTFTPTGIRDAAGVERDVETVIFATGFDVSANLRGMGIVGSRGISLDDSWSVHGAHAHLGIMVSGFPNLFLLLGPNTGLGHTSVIFMIESQIAFVLRALRLVARKRAGAIDVRASAQRRSVRKVQRHLSGSVWQSGCRSWYLDEHGRNTTIWPTPTPRYWLATRRVRRRDYQLLAPGSHR